MQKRILTSLLLASALSTDALALGLGDIEVYSALNQPLDAEIEITSAKPGEIESLLVKLASDQAFLKAGVERPFLLTKLQFTPLIKKDGTSIIRIRSDRPMREPFLNFLVDVEWPRGRLVREYTVLLDPPSFSTRKPVATAAPVAEQAPATPTGSAPIQRDTGVYGFEEPEPVTRAQAEAALPTPAAAPVPTPAPAPAPVAEPEPEVVFAEPEPVVAEEVEVAAEPEQAALVEEALAFDEPLPESGIETVDLTGVEPETPAEEASPFTSLLNDLDGEGAEEPFAENAFAPTEPEFVAPEPESYNAADLPIEGELPGIQVNLDESLPYNAESILAADNDYIDPEIEALLRADPVPLYREEPVQQEVVEIQPEAIFEPEPEPELVPEVPEGYEVQKGDIMLQIAEQFRPSDIDINQAMLAIMRYNPQAFINNNVNLVRQGYVLRIPDREAMLALSNGAALAEVQSQNALWREYRSQLAGAQSEAASQAEQTQQAASTQPADESAAGATDNAGTQLALLAPGKDDEATNYAAGQQEGDGETRRLERNLALAKEKLEASRLEKAELESRINELQAITTQSEGIINLKNQQLAQIQASAEEGNVQAEEIAEDVENAFAPSTEETAEGVEEGTETAASEEGSETEVADAAGVDATEETGEEVAGTEEVASTEVVSTVVVDESNQSQRPSNFAGGLIYDFLPLSLRQSFGPLLDGPAAWVILLLPVILIAVILMLVLRRNKEEDVELRPIQHESVNRADDSDNELPPGMTMHESKPSLMDKIKGMFGKKEEPAIVFEDESLMPSDDEATLAGLVDDAEATVSMDATQQGAVEEDMESTVIADVAETVASDSLGGDDAATDDVQDDTTAEADVYIAYGLYDQAEDLLKQAIDGNPDMIAYRGKLLETYYNSGKKEDFINSAQELNDRLGGQNSAVWSKAVAMGQEIAPENMLFSGAEAGDVKASDFAVAKPDAADFDLGDGEVEDASAPDFDLGDGDIDLGADDIDLGAADLSEEDAVDISDVAEPGPAASGEPDFDDEFSLDDVAAELDASLALDDEPAEEPAAATGDDLEFDVADFIESDEAAIDVESDGLDVDMDMDLGDSDSADLDLGDIDDADLDLGFEDATPEEVDLGSDASDDDVGLDLDIGVSLDDLDMDDSAEAPAAEAEDDLLDVSLDLDAGSMDDTDLDSAINDLDLGDEDSGVDLGSDDSADLDLGDLDDLDLGDSADDGLSLGDDDGLSLDNIDDAIVSAGDDAASSDAMDIDFDMDLGVDAEESLDTHALDDELEDDSDATQIIDDESLETMFDSVEANQADFSDAADDMDFSDSPDSLDEVGTKLDLAKAYIDMGDADGARASLEEVLEEGNASQKSEAQSLLDQIA